MSAFVRQVVCGVLAALCVIQTSLFVILTVRHAHRRQEVQRRYSLLLGRAWELQRACPGNVSDENASNVDVAETTKSRLATRADPYMERLIIEQTAMLQRHCSNDTKLCLPGPKGDPGPIGHIGVSGATGPKGEQAAKGTLGAVGDPGPTGAAGPQGPVGVKGNRGATGSTGAKGDTGSHGVKGDAGMKGRVGPVGAKGLKGTLGDRGPQGPVGAAGVAGVAGSKGEVGPKGALGPAGATGAKGASAPKRNCSCVAPPKIPGSTLQHVDVIPGGTLTLTCPITAIPNPDVTWSRDPAPLPSSVTSVANQLIIHDVKASDVGKYTCTSSNLLGSAAVAFDVKLADLNCNFERAVNLCSWQQGKTDNQDWHLLHGLTPTLNTGPFADHTVGTSSGQYIYLESSDGASGDKADLLSPMVEVKTPLCLHFWYNMNGQGIATLSLLLKTTHGAETVLWSKSGNQGLTWKEDKVTVRPSATGGQEQIIFRANRGLSNEGDIAVDDISVTPGVCIEPPGAVSCNFNVDMCVWSTAGGWNWTLHNGPSGKPDTGPTADRNNDTNTKYLYANGASAPTAGSTARLISPIFSTTNKTCLQFYYNMHGATEGTLKLIVKSLDDTDSLLWQRAGDQTQDWHQARVTLPQSSRPVNLILEAARGSGTSSDVAVDDLTITPGACPYNGLGCDFEELDLCTWSQDIRNDNFDWSLQVGGMGAHGGSPTVDHSKQTEQGHYACVSNAGHTLGQRAALMSRLLPRNAEYCLSMWVHIPSNTSGTLSVDRENFGNILGHIHTVTYHAPASGQPPHWTQVSVTIPGYYTDSGVFLLVTTGSSTAPPICVDDITLVSGPCT